MPHPRLPETPVVSTLGAETFQARMANVASADTDDVTTRPHVLDADSTEANATAAAQPHVLGTFDAALSLVPQSGADLSVPADLATGQAAAESDLGVDPPTDSSSQAPARPSRRDRSRRTPRPPAGSGHGRWGNAHRIGARQRRSGGRCGVAGPHHSRTWHGGGAHERRPGHRYGDREAETQSQSLSQPS